jgi:tRNA threonylcarbamoyladenosine modification (KEOPS) complex Cgi121 subunit
VAGWQHLYFAVLNALHAFENGLNISNSLSMEILLYASAQRQIREAVNLLGIRPDSDRVAVVVVADSRSEALSTLDAVSTILRGKQDDEVLELTGTKTEGVKRLFKISKDELEAKMERENAEEKALTDLVIEHVALLATQR